MVQNRPRKKGWGVGIPIRTGANISGTRSAPVSAITITAGTHSQDSKYYTGRVFNCRTLPIKAQKVKVGGGMHTAPVHHFHAALVADHLHAQLDPMNDDQLKVAARAQKPGLSSSRLQHSKYGGATVLAVVTGATTARAYGINAGMIGTVSNRVDHLLYESGDHAAPSYDKASTCQPTLQATPGTWRKVVATYHPALRRHTVGAPGGAAHSRVAGDWGWGKVLGRFLYDRRDSQKIVQPSSHSGGEPWQAKKHRLKSWKLATVSRTVHRVAGTPNRR